MLFGPNADFVDAFKNLNNSWAFLAHDMGSPLPKWVVPIHAEWQSYRAGWKELEGRTFSSASPDWTEVLAGLGGHISELNAAIRGWKASGKKTVAAEVDASKLDIEKGSAALQQAAAVSETAAQAEKAVKEKVKELVDDAADSAKKLAPPWWAVLGGIGLAAGAAYAFLLVLRPPPAVVRVGR
jgi:hypothetical protein